MRRYLTLEHYTAYHSGSPLLSPESYQSKDELAQVQPDWSKRFRIFKTVIDYGCAILALPLIAIMAVVLFALNPLFNPGPVFFRQPRAGQFGKSFTMWKFRTMLPDGVSSRAHDAKLEEHRITPLGRILRKTRLDELPNFINVLRGEMSVVGPRPDAANHAEHFVRSIVGYANRQRVKPGITGLAQVEQGYAEGADETLRKAEFDNIYVAHSCGRLDVYIIWRTLVVMVRGLGAR